MNVERLSALLPSPADRWFPGVVAAAIPVEWPAPDELVEILNLLEVRRRGRARQPMEVEQ
jgi:hypothetical protein